MFDIRERWSSLRSHEGALVLFLPGLFLLSIGVAALVVPQILLVLVAGVFLFLGVSFCVVAWKFLQLKRTLGKYVRMQEGQIHIYTVGPGRKRDRSEDLEKKIVYH